MTVCLFSEDTGPFPRAHILDKIAAEPLTTIPRVSTFTGELLERGVRVRVKSLVFRKARGRVGERRAWLQPAPRCERTTLVNRTCSPGGRAEAHTH